jgi:predicted kinase
MFTLICGIPNAGKTTYSSKYSNVIHMDDVVPQKKGLAYEEVCDSLFKCDSDICLEGVFVASRIRRKLCESYKGEKICLWLDTPIEECIARENRHRGTFIISNCAQHFEPPTLDEGWNEIIIIRGEHEQRICR